MYKVLQRYNNNVVLVVKDGVRMIAVGKGIGFQVEPGLRIHDRDIESIFVMKSKDEEHRFKTVIDNISHEIIEVTTQLLDVAKKNLEYDVHNTLVISLSDHLDYAIKRSQEGLVFTHPLHWEIQRVYPKEYALALSALDFIKMKLGIRLPVEEATFIAFHYVNARVDVDVDLVNETMETTRIIYELVQIIQYHFQIVLDETSLDYSRFIIHLKYYIQRVRQGKTVTAVDASLLEVASLQYQKELEVVDKMMVYLYQNYGWEPSVDERFYLMLYIKRLVNTNIG